MEPVTKRRYSSLPKKQNEPLAGQAPSQAQEPSPVQTDIRARRSKKARVRLYIPPAVLVVLVFALVLALFLGGFSLFRERSEDWLSSDDALQIALNDAGTSEGLIYDVSVRLYMEDPMIYAVGFKDYTGEYYYKLGAKTGVILEKSKPAA